MSRLAAGWTRFWFTPQPTSTLALFRIAFGLVVTGWTATLGLDLFAFIGPDGVLPEPGNRPGAWGVLALSTSPPMIVALYVATLAGALALTVGYRSRLAGVVVFVGILSFQRANPMMLNAGDWLICNLALFCALAPTGTSLSLDRLRAEADRFWEFPSRAPWALRLVQIQLSVVYLATVWSKLLGDKWREGTAVSYALRMADIHRFPTPTFLTDSVVLTELLTFGTLALELCLGILVWVRAARPWILGLGVSLHLGIEYSILVGFFSATMLTAYLAFIPAETASRIILAARDRVTRRPALVETQPAATPGAVAASTNGHRPHRLEHAGPAQ